MNGLKSCAIVLLMLLSGVESKAQFVNDGVDPDSVKYHQVSTENYQVIFPQGMEQTGIAYARALEQLVLPIGGSLGLAPNQCYRTPLPVVLRAYTGSSNGSVVWAPRRMELYTVPDPYKPEPTPWLWQLAVHESRHVAQMQLGATSKYSGLNYLVGELWPSAIVGLYGNSVFLEGDAVVAETALTETGRGRTADFLEYYRVCFLNGDTRDYWRWLYGSISRYTPDHYRIGYLTQGGISAIWAKPYSMTYDSKILSCFTGLPLTPRHNALKEISGMNFRKTWRAVADSVSTIWKQEQDARGEGMSMSPVSKQSKAHLSRKSLVLAGNDLYAIREGISNNAELVRVDPDGKEHFVHHFSSATSDLQYSDETNCIYWSEYKADKRWEQSSWSNIRCFDLSSRKIRTVVSGRRLYNPSPVPGKKTLAAVEYPYAGGSRVVLLDSETGDELRVIEAPDGIQVVEVVTLDNGKMYASGISEKGFGIYDLNGFKEVLSPEKVKINQLREFGSAIAFVSDRTGVNEWYRLLPEKRRVYQVSSTTQGACDFVEKWSGDSCSYYFTIPTRYGHHIYTCKDTDIVSKTVDFAEKHSYWIADKLSAMEPISLDANMPVEISDVTPYSKKKNLLNFHSWAPLYVEVDDVSSMSFESLSSAAALGATGYFQNVLGTMSGHAGISYNYSFLTRESIVGAHVKAVYRGWYPVLETSIDLYNTGAGAYSLKDTLISGSTYKYLAFEPLKTVDANTNIKAYVPLNFSSGGWIRGVVPQVQFGISNTYLNLDSGKVPLSRAVASVRAYTMRPTPKAAVYPELGIGAELGYSGRFGFGDLFPMVSYGHVYGYLPGLMRNQGLRLSATCQFQMGKSVFADHLMVPTIRGWSQVEGIENFVVSMDQQYKATLDYVIPFASVDCSWLCPVAYIRNFELYPHADVAYYVGAGGTQTLMYNGGVDFNVVLGNFFFLPYLTRVGIGIDFPDAQSSLGKLHHEKYYTRFIFSIDI